MLLDPAMANACAFRALLEELHARDVSSVTGAHVTAVAMVRAGILRAAIGTIIACLDPGDRRRKNRASVGQILSLLEDHAIIDCFSNPARSAELLVRARDLYNRVVDGELFKDAKLLRSTMIAHNLVQEVPDVPYHTIYQLHEEAMRLIIDLFQACDQRKPEFIEQSVSLKEHARLFWNTHFAGMRSAA